MASKAFFDPLVLLRVAPVLTSTMALRYSHDQYFFLGNLLAPEHGEKAKEIVPSYFSTFFMEGIWSIGILYTLTPAAGITNVYSKPNGAWKWYAAGTALTILHLAFVPAVMYKVKALADSKSKEEGPKLLREWLRVHYVRSWVADVPAWTCLVIGCLKSLQPL